MAPGKSPAPPARSRPQLQFVEPIFDFGKIAAGAVVNHDYVFINAGTAPLIITGVQPSCDCTTAGKWSARVEPSQSGIVPVAFDSTGYAGPIDKWMMVASNDPGRPQVMLTLKGVVEEAIAVSPPNVVFTLPAGANAGETKVIRITNHTATPLVLAPPESSNRAFTAELATIQSDKTFELRVTAVPPFSAGTIPGFITLKTNSAHVPVIAITALAVVR